MKHGREVIELLGAFPGRRFKMAEIIRHVARGRRIAGAERQRMRAAVARALDALIESGMVERRTAGERQATSYWWRA